MASTQRDQRWTLIVCIVQVEALQNYTAGYSELGQGHFLAAVPLFERATAIDPNFAMAYYYLGVAFDNAGDIARSREYSKQAFSLIDRVSEGIP